MISANRATVNLEPQHAPLLDRLYRRANADRWNVSRAAFVTALDRSTTHRFRDERPTEAAVGSYLESLHVDDLALACGCATGDDSAWEHFIAEYRPRLYRAATAIAGDAGREMADSLYGDLFGLTEREGRRRSLLEYFHGRSSLSTWLRAVLARRHVDAARTGKWMVPFDENAADPASPGSGPRDLDRPRLTRSLHVSFAAALAALDPGESLRLAYYYRQQLTLAQIGRLVGEHEATVSRKLARARTRLRRDIETRLRVDHGLADAEIDRCFELAVGPWHHDETSGLDAAPAAESTAPPCKRSTDFRSTGDRLPRTTDVRIQP